MLEQIEAIDILAKAAQQSGALVVSEIGSQTTWLHETGDHESYLYLSVDGDGAFGCARCRARQSG